MIIDAILDRKDAIQAKEPDRWTVEDLRNVYDQAMFWEFDYLSRAIDGGTEKDVQDALCRYIDEQGYNPRFKRFVKTHTWVPAEIK